MEQGEQRAAPGRLRARAGMDRVEVELPPRVRGINRAYLGLVAVLWPGFMWLFYGGEGAPWLMLLREGSRIAAVMLAPLVYSLLLALLARRAGAVSARLRLALAALGLGLPAALVMRWWIGLASGVTFGDYSYYFLVTALLCSPLVAVLFLLATLRGVVRAPRLILDGSKLEIVEGRSRRSLALESVGRFERRAGWRERVLLDGAPIGALRGLRDEERAWLFDLLEGAARRRRAALERQGHDLAAPARPPRELLETLEW